MFDITFSSEPNTPSEIDEFRAKAERGITKLAKLVHAIRAPVPNQTGDGTELVLKPDPPELLQKINDGLSDLRHLGITDIDTLIQVVAKEKTGDLWNDKTYLMEKVIQVCS
jgi:hypothetical protein